MCITQSTKRNPKKKNTKTKTKTQKAVAIINMDIIWKTHLQQSEHIKCYELFLSTFWGRNFFNLCWNINFHWMWKNMVIKAVRNKKKRKILEHWTSGVRAFSVTKKLFTHKFSFFFLSISKHNQNCFYEHFFCHPCHFAGILCVIIIKNRT
jgi:hypothetical protein